MSLEPFRQTNGDILKLSLSKIVIGFFQGFIKEDFEFNPRAKHSFPHKIAIKVPNEMEVVLKVDKVLEAEDMLDNFNPVLRFLAKNILRLKPGYFRLLSNFELEVNHEGQTHKETGLALHEIVLFKSAVSEKITEQ